MIEVQAKQCATCIYRKTDAAGRKLEWNIAALEAQIRDPNMEGHFKGGRLCHHSKTAICAGFWKRHKDHFDVGQLAQRLNFVSFVNHDTIGKRKP